MKDLILLLFPIIVIGILFYKVKISPGNTLWEDCVNVKQNFTQLGNHFFTSYGNQIFTLYGKEFFTLCGKEIFTSPYDLQVG